jgi:dCMP deaminase
MDKISYDDYFLTMCHLVAMRSIDPSTKCGSVLVSKEYKVLSTGYNGPIKGSNDELVPLTRPDKYAHLLHAEENCLLAYNGSNQDLAESTMYVTGAPCHKCLRMIIQKGVRNIVYTDGNVAVMQDNAEKAICDLMLSYIPPVTVRVVNNLPRIVSVLDATSNYIVMKNPTKFEDDPISQTFSK